MTQNRKNSGFSLAEMLIVVAIIGVLMGVSFVAVQSHQRSSTRLEFDTIAREIFFAAQNHLTSVESQGYLQQNQFGHPGKVDGVDSADADDIYYLVSGDSDSTEMLKLIMPDYAIVSEGSYIIRYQVSSAKVLDVFYSNPGKSSMLTVAGKALGTGDYAPLMSRSPDYRENGLKNRENYDGVVVGWYGGENAEEQGIRLRVPSLEIINAEKLMVRVSDPNASSIEESYLVKLIVTGKSSGAEAYFTLRDSNVAHASNSRITHPEDEPYTIVLDDITASEMHFAKISSADETVPFIPGENLEIKAVAYSVDTLSNIAMSRAAKTNSLFAELRDADGDKTPDTAVVNNIRHLENLDAAVSNLQTNGTKTGGDESYEMTGAVQVSDLFWKDDDSATNDFVSRIKTLNNTTAEPSIWLWNVATAAATSAGYYPVSPGYALTYDGQNHKLSNIIVDIDGAAGMFGALVADSEVKDLELIDFDVTAAGEGEDLNAGALVGTATNTTITNVLAYNKSISGFNTTISGADSAGGLIGSAANCTVSKCGAALVVTSTGGDAGGLIGKSAGGTVTACYSGGHTNNAKYYAETGDPIYNVTAVGNAGGLIGDAGITGISGSYSTCSATGGTAGGFVGTGSGTITNCYCTGLVSGSAEEGAFAGSLSGTATDCRYYEIINELKDTAGYTYLEAVNNAAYSGIAAFDKSAKDYQSFIGAPTGWKNAFPYDDTLTEYYGAGTTEGTSRYNLWTVMKCLEEAKKTDDTITLEIKDTDFAATHYGDWPAPEILVVNPA